MFDHSVFRLLRVFCVCLCVCVDREEVTSPWFTPPPSWVSLALLNTAHGVLVQHLQAPLPLLKPRLCPSPQSAGPERRYTDFDKHLSQHSPEDVVCLDAVSLTQTWKISQFYILSLKWKISTFIRSFEDTLQQQQGLKSQRSKIPQLHDIYDIINFHMLLSVRV